MEWLLRKLLELLYILQKSICYLIDFISALFRKLVGIETVNINGEGGDLLTHFITSPAVKNAFLGVTLIGVILLTVFVIAAILRSETADGQNKKTKGQILAKAGQSFIIFIIIPFIILAAIVFTNAIMIGIDASMTLTATEGMGSTSFGGQILVTSGYDAYIGPAGSRAEIEQMFINGTLDFNNMSVVKQYYDLTEVNYFVGIFSGLILLILFAIAVIVFIQRLFDIVLLYIVSPVSISTIPLDDGQRFKIWREMFLSKILGAYGIIFAMNLFFIITPLLSSIRFFDNNFQNGIVSLLILIGGAFAVTKANIVISQLTGNNAGAQEVQQMMSNIHMGYRLARGGVGGAAALTGRMIGGSDFRGNQKKGMSFTDNVANSTKSNRNRHEVKEENKTRSNAQKAMAVTRLATMPAGVLKDALQGGVITAGKNFVPRLKNVGKGTSFVSRADVKPKGNKPGGTDAETTETKAGKKQRTAPETANKNNKKDKQNAETVDKAKKSVPDAAKTAAGAASLGAGAMSEPGNKDTTSVLEFERITTATPSGESASGNKPNKEEGLRLDGFEQPGERKKRALGTDTARKSNKKSVSGSASQSKPSDKSTVPRTTVTVKPDVTPADGNKKSGGKGGRTK